MRNFSGMQLASLLLFIHAAAAAQFKNFSSDPPVNPNNDNELVIEMVWQLDQYNLAEAATHIQWIPGTNNVVLSQKHGILRFYESVESDVNDYAEILDIREEVNSEGDHGLLSFIFHPNFAETPQVFVMYTGNVQDVTTLPNNDVVAPRRPADWGMSPTGGYVWPNDLCPYLDYNNEYGKICEKMYYIDRYNVDLSGTYPVLTKDITLFNGACGSSISHGPGTILEVNGDLIFSMGDGSQYAVFDAGFQNTDGCYVPNGGLDQGFFRAQRLEFANGKVMRLSAAQIDSDYTLDINDATIISKGVRQPFRMHYHKSADKLYTADIGFGDDWGTSERIFKTDDVSTFADSDTPLNRGWPCIEGIYMETTDMFTQAYSVISGAAEQERRDYLTFNNLDTCDGVYSAVEAFVTGNAPAADADLNWTPPLFEYRNDLLDPDYPSLCGTTNAALTALFIYEGTSFPAEYQGKLIFADYVKDCVWYFDNDENGDPDFQSMPHVLMANANVIDIQLGADNFIYMIDYVNARVTRMYQYGAAAQNGEVTEPPTIAPTSAPVDIPDEIAEGQICFEANNMPELQWTRNPDGTYEADLILGVVTVETALGTTRTRAFNGLIPGPLIRMKPCETYILNVYNDMGEWPAGFDGAGAVNGLKDPTITNIHLHGLHISGEPPGDDPFVVIGPGEMNQYIYIIPCDHSSGTHWYHPHHHGSVALQTDAGAAGMLIMESSPLEASGIPLDIQAMPEQYLVFQEMDPTRSTRFATESKDSVYVTDIVDGYVLINGCDAIEISVEAGQWTRFRMLNIAHEFTTLLTIKLLTGEFECDVGVLAKDGVWVAEVPRTRVNNDMFMTISSRVDIAIRCPEAGSVHSINYLQLGNPAAETATQVGTIVVLESFRDPAPDLTVWEPCRPAYLMDIETLPGIVFMDPLNLEVRDGLNSELFIDKDDYFFEMEINTGREMIIAGSELHTTHIHINHFQYSSKLSEENQWPEIIDWFEVNDWADSIANPGAVSVNIYTERYVGHMVLHCHVAEHGDNGIMGVINITGEGDEGDGDPSIVDYGTCSADIPESTPYESEASPIPGTVEAEHFDEGGEGIAYHNHNIARNVANALRPYEAVEIDVLDDIYWVGYIRNGEYLRYTVDVEFEGYYTLSMNYASGAPEVAMRWSMWLDTVGCPAELSDETELVRVADDLVAGTGSYIEFEAFEASTPVMLTDGTHTLSLCFEGADAGYNFDSLTFEYCGLLETDCENR